MHGKRIFLGRYVQLEEAIRVRREAEEKYFAPLIEQKEGEKRDSDTQ